LTHGADPTIIVASWRLPPGAGGNLIGRNITMTNMLKGTLTLVAGLALVGWAQAATAAERTQPVQLTTLQMDAVSAGGSYWDHWDKKHEPAEEPAANDKHHKKPVVKVIKKIVVKDGHKFLIIKIVKFDPKAHKKVVRVVKKDLGPVKHHWWARNDDNNNDHKKHDNDNNASNNDKHHYNYHWSNGYKKS
jgi:hypothetical protein